MPRIQLKHPEGKKAPTMDANKYDVLSASLLTCLQKLQQADFDELLQAVAADLDSRQVRVEGKLAWNLFTVSLHLVAIGLVLKDRSVSPIIYRLTADE